jgi:hypothetical protein
MPGEGTRIDLDQVTAFFGKFPETAPSEVPQLLGTKMINVVEGAAAALRDCVMFALATAMAVRALTRTRSRAR